MQYTYTQHHDFIQSVVDFYKKHTNYRNAAQRVLAALAKSNYPNFFKHSEVFYGLQKTNNGENRIRHCIKYDLQKASRLITLEDQSTCAFLFLGTHDEAEDWIDSHCGLTIDNIKKQNESLTDTQNSIAPNIENQRIKLESLLDELEKTEKDISERIDLLGLKAESFFKEKSHSNFNDLKSNYNKLKSNFISINKPEFIFRLENLKSTTNSGSILSSIKGAQDLEFHTELIQLKVKYIHLFKEYVYLTKVVH